MATFKVEEIIENEDGSAQLILDMDSEMTQFLIEHAVKDILTKAIVEMETEETHGIK